MSLQQSPQDQRSVLIGSVLIALILFVWMWYTTPGVEQKPSSQEPPITDTTEARQEQQMVERQRRIDQQQEARGEEPSLPTVADSTIAGAQQGTERRITVDTDLYEAVFSTKGATLVSFTLKEYQQFDQETPVQIVDTTNAGALAMVFTTPQNHLVDSRSFYFEASQPGGGGIVPDRIQLSGEDTAQITFTARVGQGVIEQTYTFTGDTYQVDLSVDQQNAASFATNSGYDLVWDGGVPFTEGSPEDEAAQAGAFARSGGEIVELRLQSEDAQEDRSLNGQVDWAAVKNKYFTAVMIPGGPTRGAELVGDKPVEVDGRPFWKDFTARLEIPAPRPGEADTYRLYLGPMEYYKLAAYDLGLYGMVDYGWNIFEWITRPLATFFFIPLFTFLSSFIPSYGVVIILLAVFIKTLVYPLTKSSYKSMAKMRELQPQMEAIKEQHGDNPQKQQEAMMKLYKDAGANPLGGCLPMLLQYPVIIALYQFIPQSIQLRQQSFLWAHDLSAPDVILNLPFTIPFFGDYVAGFTLLMGLSMVVTMQTQSSMSAGGGQMKVLMYVMPVMIFFIFNRFASALSLYYLFYNIVTAIQQHYINKQIHAEEEEKASTNGKGSATDAKKAKRRRKKKARTS